MHCMGKSRPGGGGGWLLNAIGCTEFKILGFFGFCVFLQKYIYDG